MTERLASTAVDARAERRAAARRNPDWSLLGAIEVIDRFTRVLAEHTADGYGGLAELHAAVLVTDLLDDVIDRMAVHLLAREACSYREVAVALGLSRQAVAKRYRTTSARPPGGQQAHLR